METVADFISLGSKITVDGDHSYEIERRLLPGRKAMTNPVSVLKRRDSTLPTKVRTVKAIVFPVVLHGYESWTIKKAECCEELILLNCGAGEDSESPLDSKEIKSVNPKGNQSWIFIRRTDAKAESSNILATWSEVSTHQKRPWDWERLKVEGEGGDRGWDGWVASLTQCTWVEQTVGDSERQGNLACYSPWGCKESDMP